MELALLAAALEHSSREHEENARVGPPPTSKDVLERLPVVRVTAHDLAQDGNDHCCVCLEAHELGSDALKLPCGHLYHEACAKEWLKQHCTCPNCRYELPTDDREYESGRKDRMRHRRPRYRVEELLKMTVRELRDMLADADVSSDKMRGACEKRDLVRCLIDARAVDIVAEPAPLKLDVDAATIRRDWSTRQLKDLMIKVGVDASDCIEKTELVDTLLASGRVLPSPASTSTSNDIQDLDD